MTYDPTRHHRHSIRLPGYDYTQAGAYFVTMVTTDRACLFGDVVDGAMVLSALAFMSHHVIVLAHFFDGLTIETVVLSLGIAVGGVAWAWQYDRSKSLVGPWISHLVVDAGIFLICYDIVKDVLG